MPGPVSDSYDPEFGTRKNANIVKDGLEDVVEISLNENLKYNNNYRIILTEKQLRLIRFSINRTLEDI